MHTEIIEHSFPLKDGNILQMFQDDCPNSPREWDNLGKMVCFHKNYELGDEHDYKHSDYNSWYELGKAIIHKERPAVIKPLFLLDHSGITISTKDFNDKWDSGQVGFIYVPRGIALFEYNTTRLTPTIKKKLDKILDAEVQTYDQYLRGEVYGYRIIDPKGEEIESTWGFYGDNIHTNGMLDSAGVELAD